MDKETEEQNQVSAEKHDPSRDVTEKLQNLLRRGAVTINIEGEEHPYELVGWDITNVVAGSAWIGFTHNGCAFRTKDPKDRENFLALLKSGYCDARNIRFTKQGILTRPAALEETEKKHPFVPRGRRIYSRSMLMEVERRELAATD